MSLATFIAFWILPSETNDGEFYNYIYHDSKGIVWNVRSAILLNHTAVFVKDISVLSSWVLSKNQKVKLWFDQQL